MLRPSLMESRNLKMGEAWLRPYPEGRDKDRAD